MNLAWLRRLVGIIPLMAIEAPTTQTEIWVSKEGNDTTGNGSFNKPFLTFTAAFAAVTNTKKVIRVLPGVYTEAAGLTWPAFSGVQLIGTGTRFETEVRASAGDQVFDVTPGVVASTFELTIQDLHVNHDETGQDGILLDNTGMTKKLNCYFGNLGFDGSSSDYGIQCVHADADNAIRIYWEGGNGDVESKIDLASANGGDRFYVDNVIFKADIDAGTDVASTIRLRNTQILHEGFSGGGTSVVVDLISCWSLTGSTYAACDNTDITANSSITGPNVF